MVYMAGDSALTTDAGKDDLKEMSLIGSTPDVNIVVEFDREKDEGSTYRYLVKKSEEGVKFDDIGDIVKDLGEVNSGDPRSLEDFIFWSVDNYPADRYALILWGHGLGWNEWDKEKHEVDATLGSNRVSGDISTGNPPKSLQEYRASQQQYRALFRIAVEKHLALYSPHLERICKDEISMQSIDLKELSNVLSKTKDKLGRKIDLLGMDACYMSTIEVAYEIAPFARCMVASEEEVPGFLGWPYDDILNRLVEQPRLNATDLAEHIVYSYINRCKNNGKFDAINAAFDLSMVDEVARRLDGLARALIEHMPESVTELDNAQRRSKKFIDQWDIHAFSKELQGLTSDAAVERSAKEICNILDFGLGKLIIAQSHLLANYDQCCGASIYLLHSGREVSPIYAGLEFAKSTRWLPMLQEYHRYAMQG
jgi:hypothetical protein